MTLLEALLVSDARLRDFGAVVPTALHTLYLRLLTNATFKTGAYLARSVPLILMPAK